MKWISRIKNYPFEDTDKIVQLNVFDFIGAARMELVIYSKLHIYGRDDRNDAYDCKYFLSYKSCSRCSKSYTKAAI